MRRKQTCTRARYDLEKLVEVEAMESEAGSGEQPADKYEGWLDCSFDEQIGSLKLPWLPWVGAGFREQKVRTLVLGESVYDYSRDDAAKRQKILHQDSLRMRHLNHAILAKSKSRYVRNFERAYYGRRKPSSQQRQDLWACVAYHNLVLRMLNSRKARPSDVDYAKGWEQFLELAVCLGVQQVVVYGLERRKINALRSLPSLTGRVQDLEVRAAAGVKPVGLSIEIAPRFYLRMLFIRHPSAYFRWEEWGEVVRQFCRVPA